MIRFSGGQDAGSVIKNTRLETKFNAESKNID